MLKAEQPMSAVSKHTNNVSLGEVVGHVDENNVTSVDDYNENQVGERERGTIILVKQWDENDQNTGGAM